MQLGKYLIEKKIGTGGMAEIYLATLKTDRNAYFAIKKILPHFANDQNLIGMLVNEAKVSVSLRHPNIVPIYDFGRIEDSYYLAMEFVSGFDLKTVINKSRKVGEWIPLRLALYIVMEVLEGLAYAHKRRDNYNRPLEIVHRDISPQNIMISNQGEVKILDFGIAKVSGMAQTQAGVLKGKFSYMSPEQASGEPVDRSTDIFSTGILLYELLTLENPFLGESEMQTLDAVKRANFKSPRQFNKNVSKNLEKVVEQGLARKPRNRFQSAADFQTQLFKIQREEVGFAGPVELKQYLAKIVHGVVEPDQESTQYESQPAAKQYQFARRDRTTGIYFILQRWRRRGVFFLGMIAGSLVAGYVAYWLAKNPLNLRQTSAKWLEKGRMAVLRTIATPTPVPVKQSALSLIKTAQLPIHFKPEVRRLLNDLSFEQYEVTRDSIIDQLAAHIEETFANGLSPQQKYSAKIGKYNIEFAIAPSGEAIEVTSLLR